MKIEYIVYEKTYVNYIQSTSLNFVKVFICFTSKCIVRYTVKSAITYRYFVIDTLLYIHCYIYIVIDTLLSDTDYI